MDEKDKTIKKVDESEELEISGGGSTLQEMIKENPDLLNVAVAYGIKFPKPPVVAMYGMPRPPKPPMPQFPQLPDAPPQPGTPEWDALPEWVRELLLKNQPQQSENQK